MGFSDPGVCDDLGGIVRKRTDTGGEGEHHGNQRIRRHPERGTILTFDKDKTVGLQDRSILDFR
jgi:hypothetical protein